MGSDGPRTHHILLGGGIGAGKSSVARLFAESGYLEIAADRVGVDVLRPGTEATVAVAREWPIVVSGGVVDRSALALIVFSDGDALRLLESITHPAIVAEIDRRVAGTDRDVVVETPVRHLELTGNWIRVAVVADEDTRIARAVARGGDPDDVRRRVASQVRDEDWEDWADVVVSNSGPWSETQQMVLAMIKGLKA